MPRQINPMTLESDQEEMNFRVRSIPKDLADLDVADVRLPDPPAAPKYVALPVPVPEPDPEVEPEPEKKAPAKKAAPARKAAPPRKKKD